MSTFPVDIFADVGTAFGPATPPSPRPAVRRRDGAASTRTSAPAGRADIDVLPAPSAATRSARTSASVNVTTPTAMKRPVSNGQLTSL